MSILSDRTASPALRPATPMLVGNWRPVQRELDLESVEVLGRIPEDLTGVYVRTGPNPLFPAQGPNHLFDGDGMVHAIYISPDHVRYKNRYVQTEAWAAARQAGHAVRTGLASPPARGPWSQHSPYANTANAAVIWHDDRLLALSEFGAPYRLDPASLETLGVYAAGHRLAPFSAHTRFDAATAELWFLRYFVDGSNEIEIDALGPGERCVTLARLAPAVPIMTHDFAISEHYVVFFQLPPFFDREVAERARSGWTGAALLPAALVAVDRRGGRTAKFAIQPGTVSHLANAFERDGCLFVYGIRFAGLPAFLAFDPEERERVPSEHNRGQLYEYCVNLSSGEVIERSMTEPGLEFPRIHEAYTGRVQRYVYAVREGRDGGIVRVDLQSRLVQTHRFGPSRYAGEPIFVPRHHSSAEDDGYVLTWVWDSISNRSQCVVLDAGHLEDAPLATLRLDARVPFGFHGTWIPMSFLSSSRLTA